MDSEKLEEIREIFASHPEVKLAYLFGSRATGNVGPMSDYDFGVYFDGLDKNHRFDMKLQLMSKLSKVLNVDTVDIVNLNDTDMPELTYAMIQEGIVIKETEPFRLLVESRIRAEYFDFHLMLKRHGLTRVP